MQSLDRYRAKTSLPQEASTTVWQGGGPIWQKQKGKVWLLSGPVTASDTAQFMGVNNC